MKTVFGGPATVCSFHSHIFELASYLTVHISLVVGIVVHSGQVVYEENISTNTAS